jgi:hypothetical protein
MHRDAQQDWATSRHSADTPSYIEKVGTGEMYAGLHPQTYMPCEITHHWKRWRTALITHAEASKCLHMHYIHHHPSSSIIIHHIHHIHHATKHRVFSVEAI